MFLQANIAKKSRCQKRRPPGNNVECTNIVTTWPVTTTCLNTQFHLATKDVSTCHHPPSDNILATTTSAKMLSFQAILTLSLQYQLIRKTMEKQAKRKLTTIVILLNKNFLIKLDPTLKVLKVADIHKCQIWLFTIVRSVSDTCWPANSRYYRLHLLFYQLRLRQITLSSHHHDQSGLWAALASGRTRSFLSLTWWSPQESHLTSQVMLHWSEKCKTRIR